MDKDKVLIIVKQIWDDGTKWGQTFLGDTPAVNKWLDKKAQEICELDTKNKAK